MTNKDGYPPHSQTGTSPAGECSTPQAWDPYESVIKTKLHIFYHSESFSLLGVLFCIKHISALFHHTLCLCVSLKCYYVYTCNHIFCTSGLFCYHQHVCLSSLAHLGDPTQAMHSQRNYHYHFSQHYKQTILLNPQGLHFLHPIFHSCTS